MFLKSIRFRYRNACAAAISLLVALSVSPDSHAQAVASNVALGKPVSVVLNGAADSAPGAWNSGVDITDGSLDYQPASSMAEDGVVGFFNNDYNEPMTVTVTINLGADHDISAIRYNMGDVQFGDTWKPDVMETPFGESPTVPGGSYEGAWTEHIEPGGRIITASTVDITFKKTRLAWNEDWLFIGEIEIYGTPHGGSSDILEDPEQEAYNPTLISPTTSGSYETSLQGGPNFFKFEVEPGYSYSFIVNTNYYNHLLSSKGAAYSVYHGNSGYQSQVSGLWDEYHGTLRESPAKSAIMFTADPGYYAGKYYNYVHIYTEGDVPVAHIRLVKKFNKHFGHPFEGLHAYYNSFGHRALINNGTYLTENGHDGIDIAAYTENLDTDFTRPIVPVADGQVAHIEYVGTDLGEALWVHHTLDGQPYTSLYAHLQDIEVSVGDRVGKGITTLGYMSTAQKHLHLEIFKKHTKEWWYGYSNGGGGQVDPLGEIFEN